MQAYAFYYAFSMALFVLIVAERVLNASATLLVRLAWGTGGASAQAARLSLGTAASTTGDFEVFGVILEHLAQELGVRDDDFDAQARHALAVHTSQRFQNTQSDIKGYASMQMVGAGASFFSTLSSSFFTCVVSAVTALSAAYIAWAAAATVVFALLFILQENYSDVMIEAVDEYNKTYGALVHKWFFIPLQVSMLVRRA